MKLKLLTLFITLICLTGCYDRLELEQQAYVIAIGADKTDTKGVFAFTYQVANPAVNLPSGQGSNEPPVQIFTVEGNDFLNATHIANSFLTKEIKLDQAKVIIISEELASSDDFLRLIQTATKYPALRSGIEVIVSKEKAKDFIKNNTPKTESRFHRFYESVFSSAMDAGLIPRSSMHRFFQITEGDADLFLAIYATSEQANERQPSDEIVAGQIPKSGGPPTQFLGSAVLKEGKMIDLLDGEETRLAHILDPTLDMNNYVTSTPDPLNPDYKITYTYSQDEDAKVDIHYHKDKPTDIDVKVNFKVEINAVPSLISYTKNLEHQKKLKETIIKRIEKKANDLVKKSQEEYGSDPFYWSLYVRDHFKTIPDFEKADWNNEIFPNANVNITFEMDQLEFGKVISDTELNEVRD